MCTDCSLKFPFPSSPLEAQNGKESGENTGKQGKMGGKTGKSGSFEAQEKHVPRGKSGEFPGKIKLICSAESRQFTAETIVFLVRNDAQGRS